MKQTTTTLLSQLHKFRQKNKEMIHVYPELLVKKLKIVIINSSFR